MKQELTRQPSISRGLTTIRRSQEFLDSAMQGIGALEIREVATILDRDQLGVRQGLRDVLRNLDGDEVVITGDHKRGHGQGIQPRK